MKTRSTLLVLLATAAMFKSSTTAEAHLIEKMDDRGWAQFVPKSIEYNWQHVPDHLRASLANMKLPDTIDSPIFPVGAPVSLLGDRDAWEEQWIVPLPAGATPRDVLKSINDVWATEKNWTSLKRDRIDSSVISILEFTDQTGKSWIATASVESSATKNGHALVTLRIEGSATLSNSYLEKGTCALEIGN